MDELCAYCGERKLALFYCESCNIEFYQRHDKDRCPECDSTSIVEEPGPRFIGVFKPEAKKKEVHVVTKHAEKIRELNGYDFPKTHADWIKVALVLGVSPSRAYHLEAVGKPFGINVYVEDILDGKKDVDGVPEQSAERIALLAKLSGSHFVETWSAYARIAKALGVEPKVVHRLKQPCAH